MRKLPKTVEEFREDAGDREEKVADATVESLAKQEYTHIPDFKHPDKEETN